MIFQFHKGDATDTYVDTNRIIAVQHKKNQPTPIIVIFLDNGVNLEAHYSTEPEKAKKDFYLLLNDLKERTGNGDTNYL